MNRSQLEHIIRASAAILATDEFIVVGSQSVLGTLPNPPPALAMSIETNLYPAGLTLPDTVPLSAVRCHDPLEISDS